MACTCLRWIPAETCTLAKSSRESGFNGSYLLNEGALGVILVQASFQVDPTTLVPRR